MLLFVYGTLKRGGRLNDYMEDSTFICEAVAKGFDMYTNRMYPYIVEGEGTVYGELFEVNSSVTMTRLNSLEREYEPTEITVDTESGKEECIAYVYKGDVRESWDKIEGGIFS